MPQQWIVPRNAGDGTAAASEPHRCRHAPAGAVTDRDVESGSPNSGSRTRFGRCSRPSCGMAGATAGTMRVARRRSAATRTARRRGHPAGHGPRRRAARSRSGAGNAPNRAIPTATASAIACAARKTGSRSTCPARPAGTSSRCPCGTGVSRSGTLSLHFDGNCALPSETMPLLRATGELIGVALENARLTRENLRASLMQRAAADGQRGPRFAGPGAHLHAHADEPAARRRSSGRRTARVQVLERRRRLAHRCAMAGCAS